MDTKAEKIKSRIEKLTEQLHKIEERQERSVAKIIKDMSKKGIDTRVLAGMILSAEKIIKSSPEEIEVWQAAGEKFLHKSKNKSAPSKVKSAKK